MSKRIASQFISTVPSKKAKTDDTTNKMIESLEKLSLSSKHSYNALSSIGISNVTRVNELRNNYQEAKFNIKIFTEVRNNVSEDFKTTLETLKTSLLQLQSHGPKDIDVKHLFLNVFEALSKLRLKKSERFFNVEFPIRNEFAYNHAQLFSEQYFANKENNTLFDGSSSLHSLLLDDKPICRKEANIEARQILECIAQIAEKSSKLSEQLLTQIIVLEISQTDETTIIDLICTIANAFVKDSRYISRNFGFIIALTRLLQSLTVHYGKYDDLQNVNKGLKSMFALVIRLVTYDIQIMLSLSESLINIAKYPDRRELLSSMCISHSIRNQEYSKTFKLYLMEICGCKFQIFFILLNHVFRFYENESLQGGKLEGLIQITTNLNVLAYILLANNSDIKFLVPSNDYDNVCDCYRFFLMSSLILNTIILRNQNSNPNVYETIIASLKDGIIILNGILNYSRQTTAFWQIKFPQSAMNEIYLRMKYTDIMIFNDSKTRIVATNFFNTSANCFHEFFLEKFNSNEIPCPVIETSDKNNNIGRTSSKGLENSVQKMSKNNLFTELADNFRADESVMFGFDK